MIIHSEFDLGHEVKVKPDYQSYGLATYWYVVSVVYDYEGVSYGLESGMETTTLAEDALEPYT